LSRGAQLGFFLTTLCDQLGYCKYCARPAAGGAWINAVEDNLHIIQAFGINVEDCTVTMPNAFMEILKPNLWLKNEHMSHNQTSAWAGDCFSSGDGSRSNPHTSGGAPDAYEILGVIFCSLAVSAFARSITADSDCNTDADAE